MSRSYKKNAFCSYEWSKENKVLHHRLERRALKQYIHNCVDWDEFLLPKIYPEDWMDCGCYRQWCDCYYETPLLNECEVKYQQDLCSGYTWSLKAFDGSHFRWCNCYTNKKSKWWKAKRK